MLYYNKIILMLITLNIQKIVFYLKNLNKVNKYLKLK